MEQQKSMEKNCQNVQRLTLCPPELNAKSSIFHYPLVRSNIVKQAQHHAHHPIANVHPDELPMSQQSRMNYEVNHCAMICRKKEHFK